MQLFNNFTELYFYTINPNTKYSDLINVDIDYSIILHWIIYISLFYVIFEFLPFKIPKGTFPKLTLFLLIAMSTGFPLRLARSKSIYNSLLAKNMSEEKAFKKTMKLMSLGYFHWYFLS